MEMGSVSLMILELSILFDRCCVRERCIVRVLSMFLFINVGSRCERFGGSALFQCRVFFGSLTLYVCSKCFFV